MVPLPPAPRALPGRVEEEEERAGEHHDQRDDERREMNCRRSNKKKGKKKAVNRTVLTNCSNKENIKVCDNLFFVRKKIRYIGSTRFSCGAVSSNFIGVKAFVLLMQKMPL